jgi:hypothetical protein
MLDAKALAVRLGRDQPLELGDELVVPAESELRVVEQLERAQSPLLQPGRLRLVDGLAREVGERGADPEPDGAAEILRGLARACRRESGRGRLDEPVEPRQVELPRIEPQPVAGPVPLDAVRPERPPQPVDVDLERRDGRAGRVLSPQRVDEPVARDDGVRVQEQQGEQRALLGRA